ncbi:MAG: glycosyltransferase family 2 protein, partial [Verrucomicrobia bacterium]|nr:glycosyltransferase family 2 protein [Verrucomicrobiota bacterium]
GAREAHGDVVVFLSQDASPADDHWLEHLLAPFEDAAVAATYSRQVPRNDANPMEQFFLSHRFPAGPSVVREQDGRTGLMLEDVFFSNVSAAVRRDLLCEHPFDDSLIMSEDQQLSRDLMAAGYHVVYQPDSVVCHSHNYNLKTVFRRYFDSVYSLRQIFPAHGLGTSVKMGMRYLASEVVFMLRDHPRWLPYYVLYTGAKTAGTLASHLADRLPRRLVRRLSLHPDYWGAR